MEHTQPHMGPTLLEINTNVGGGEMGANSPPDDNKICQWCCCYCGKSYGSIMYTDGYFDMREDQDFLANSLKHYSSIVYGAPERGGTRGSYAAVEPNRGRDAVLDEYYEPDNIDLRRSKSLPGVNGNKIAQVLEEGLEQDQESSPQGVPDSISPSSFNHRAVFSESGSSQSTPTTPGILLDTPSRYTCQRCNHMMCPYCPKLRFKDLKLQGS